jgi:hypothetical protein
LSTTSSEYKRWGVFPPSELTKTAFFFDMAISKHDENVLEAIFSKSENLFAPSANEQHPVKPVIEEEQPLAKLLEKQAITLASQVILITQQTLVRI